MTADGGRQPDRSDHAVAVGLRRCAQRVLQVMDPAQLAASILRIPMSRTATLACRIIPPEAGFNAACRLDLGRRRATH